MKKITVALVVALPLLGHDITLFPRQHGRVINVSAKYGHPGDYSQADVHKMLELVMYAPGSSAAAHGKDLQTEGQAIVIAPVNVPEAQDGIWLFATRYDNGFYVKMPDGRSVATTKMEAPTATTSTRNVKFGKAAVLVNHSSKDYARVVGHRLEVVPQSNPFEAKPGSKLPVLIRFDGKPLAQVGVELGDGEIARKEEDIPRYETKSSGVAEIPISKKGLQVIGVDYKTASSYPQLATEDAYTATFTFELK